MSQDSASEVALEQGPGKEVFYSRRCWLINNPSKNGTQLCEVSFKMLFVTADTHLLLPLVLFKEVKPAFTQGLKSLIFSLGLSETFHFILDDYLCFSTREQLGDLQVKLVLRNL